LTKTPENKNNPGNYTKSPEIIFFLYPRYKLRFVRGIGVIGERGDFSQFSFLNFFYKN